MRTTSGFGRQRVSNPPRSAFSPSLLGSPMLVATCHPGRGRAELIAAESALVGARLGRGRADNRPIRTVRYEIVGTTDRQCRPSSRALGPTSALLAILFFRPWGVRAILAAGGYPSRDAPTVARSSSAVVRDARLRLRPPPHGTVPRLAAALTRAARSPRRSAGGGVGADLVLIGSLPALSPLAVVPSAGPTPGWASPPLGSGAPEARRAGCARAVPRSAVFARRGSLSAWWKSSPETVRPMTPPILTAFARFSGFADPLRRRRRPTCVLGIHPRCSPSWPGVTPCHALSSSPPPTPAAALRTSPSGGPAWRTDGVRSVGVLEGDPPRVLCELEPRTAPRSERRPTALRPSVGSWPSRG